MIYFNVFSRLKNFFTKFNPINSFNFEDNKMDFVDPITSVELLKYAINKYPNFEKIILIAIYHLFNTQNEYDEYLTVLTKDNRLIVDLLVGDHNNVKIPDIVKVEGKKKIF